MDSRSIWLLVFLVVVGVGTTASLWLIFGREPRRRRVYRHIQRLLQEGKWNEALAGVRQLRELGPLSSSWDGRARNAEGECERQAGDKTLGDKQYEQGLEHLLTSARLLSLSETEARERVVGTMLAEVRRLFADNAIKVAEIRALIDRVLKLQAACPEALFWQGLCHVREGNVDGAVESLRASHEVTDKAAVDPPLYLGALLMRHGRTGEALRYLSVANRLEPACPFVGLQLGLALVAANADASLAIRALQRAVGPRGLALWSRAPEKAWVEGFPDPARSFVPRLARQHRFVCPILGSDVAALVRQGLLALAQANYRLSNFPEAAKNYDTLLNEAPPTLPVLRGLGLSLARMQRYDEAFKHLRAASEMEEPKNPLTSGYLALCGACAKPNKIEDKPSNVAWAVRLLAKTVTSETPAPVAGQAAPNAQQKSDDGRASPEWAGICSAILAEARAVRLPVALDDQVRFCETLASVEAADAAAAGAYDQLAATDQAKVQPRHAWLYCRAAQEHGFRGDRDLDLFALTFRGRDEAQAFYAQRSWDFEEVEWTYLQRWAAQRPGCFPPELGDYARRAEQLLLGRSQRKEEAKDTEASLAAATLFLQLVPNSAQAHDRLAQLVYRQGDLDRTAQLLAAWQKIRPGDHRPLLRLAVLQQQRGDFAARTAALDGALALTRGRARADVAFLGAQLALAEAVASDQGLGAGEKPTPDSSSVAVDGDSSLAPGPQSLTTAFRYLDECLQAQPDHADGLAFLAALRWQAGDLAGLKALAPAMRRPDVKSGRFQYLAAVCEMAGADYPQMLEAATRAATDQALGVEGHFLIGLARLYLRDVEAAAAALEPVALVTTSPSADQARAWLGRICFAHAVYNDAVSWWQLLDAGKRTAWKFDEPFRGTVFLAALQAYGAGRFEQAAEQFRQAGRLGYRDRSLGQLLGLALFKEGQRRFYAAVGSTHGTANNRDSGDLPPLADPSSSDHVPADNHKGPPPTLESAATFLEHALKVGLKDAGAFYLLALVHKRRGKIEESRDCLRRITPPDADVCLQLGLLSLKERQLAQAEPDLAQAWQLNPRLFAAGANLLLARLTLGRSAEAVELGPAVVALAPDPEEWYLFTLLHAVLRTSRDGTGPAATDPVLQQMTPEDEQRLLRLLRGLGHLDTVNLLLKALTAARPDSAALREAYFEATVLAGKRLLDRCEWAAAERLLQPLERQREVAAPILAAYCNLRGSTAGLCQDLDGAIRHFQAALRFNGADLNVHQNLALTHEWLSQLDKAEMHWNRYFDLLERRRANPSEKRDYWLALSYDGYLRLGGVHSDKERWPQALYYLEAAQRLRPDNVETMERLFHLYHQCRRPDQARRMLQQLQQLRPGEPQFELYELDLIEINELDDMERWLADIARIAQRYPSDARVEDRASAMIGNAVSYMTRTSDQLTEQLNKIMKQVRSLDNYQINWSAVHDVMRDLRREFQKLRRLVSKGHTLATNAEHRRLLRELAEHLDRKVDYCRRWQGD